MFFHPLRYSPKPFSSFFSLSFWEEVPTYDDTMLDWSTQHNGHRCVFFCAVKTVSLEIKIRNGRKLNSQTRYLFYFFFAWPLSTPYSLCHLSHIWLGIKTKSSLQLSWNFWKEPTTKGLSILECDWDWLSIGDRRGDKVLTFILCISIIRSETTPKYLRFNLFLKINVLLL